MWKQCDAAEQLAADKRQRRNAAKRAKQDASGQRAGGTPRHKPAAHDSLRSFVEKIDGNLPCAIRKTAYMLDLAHGLCTNQEFGHLLHEGVTMQLFWNLYQTARGLQREFRRR